MSAPACERANTVTSDESMPPDSWQPTLTSLKSCEPTLRRITSSSRSIASSRVSRAFSTPSGIDQ